MQPTSHISFRPSRLREILEHFPPDDRYPEVLYASAEAPSDARHLVNTLRRLGTGRRLLLPAGQHPCETINRSIFIRGTSSAAVLMGTVRVHTEHLVLTGLEIHAAQPDIPALLLESGTVILDGCTIKGGIKCEPKTTLFLRNCLVTGGDEAISAQQASVELTSTRIQGSQIGLALRNESSGALYHSHIRDCSNPQESDWGAGLLAQASEIYCEGVTFVGNDVGIYLKECPSAVLLFSLLDKHRVAGIVSTSTEKCFLKLRSCRITGQSLPANAQITLTGGTCEIFHSSANKAPATALVANQVALKFQGCLLASENETALELQSCLVSASKLTCESAHAAALIASNCQGQMQESRFIGSPPVESQNSPTLQFEDCEISDIQSAITLPLPEDPAASAEEFIRKLVSAISQESVRIEVARILHLAHASHQRELSGKPLSDKNFHAIFSGSAESGKIIASRVLAEGLKKFGITVQPDVQEITIPPHSLEGTNGLWETTLTQANAGSTILLHVPRADLGTDLRHLRSLVEDMVQLPQTVLILDGPRDEMRFLAKSSPALERAFRHFLQFTSYGPLELMTLFVQLCEKDQIPLSPAATLCALILCHKNCDRKDKRLTTIESIQTTYEGVRQRYLERCSRHNRFDLPLSPRDFEILLEKPLRLIVERSPAFATFCPSCSKENPWVNGLGDTTVCAHCGTAYNSAWGFWKDSLSYRHIRDSLSYVAPNTVARHLPPPTFRTR